MARKPLVAIPSGNRFLTQEGRIIRPGSSEAELLGNVEEEGWIGPGKQPRPSHESGQPTKAPLTEGASRLSEMLGADTRTFTNAPFGKATLPQYDPAEIHRASLEAAAGVSSMRDSEGQLVEDPSALMGENALLSPKDERSRMVARTKLKKLAPSPKAATAKRKENEAVKAIEVGERYLDKGVLEGFLSMKEQVHSDLINKRINKQAYDYIMKQAYKRLYNPEKLGKDIPGHTIQRTSTEAAQAKVDLDTILDEERQAREERERKEMLDKADLLGRLESRSLAFGAGEGESDDEQLRQYLQR